MGQGFKEVASLRGDDKKFEENYSKIKWTADKKEETEKVLDECADDLFEDETDDEE